MANPRYALQDSGNPHDNKLGLALQFANLGLEQQGQADREHSAKVASAIQLLGLMDQQQNDQANQQHAMQMLQAQQGNYASEAEHRKALESLTQTGQADEIRHRGVMEQQGQQSFDAARDDRNMQNWQATDAANRAWQMLQGTQKHEDAVLAATQGNYTSEAAHRTAIEKQARESEQQANIRAVLSHLGMLPGMTPASYGQAAADLGVPGADVMVKRGQDALVNSGTSAMQTALGPIYQDFQNHPAGAQKALDTAWNTFPQLKDPGIQAALQPWLQQQNDSLASPQASAPAQGALQYNGPSFQTSGVAGILKSILSQATNPSQPGQPSGEELRQQDLNSPWNPYNILFGRKQVNP